MTSIFEKNVGRLSPISKTLHNVNELEQKPIKEELKATTNSVSLRQCNWANYNGFYVCEHEDNVQTSHTALLMKCQCVLKQVNGMSVCTEAG